MVILSSALSERLVKVLPPAFLLLLILNVAFLGAITYVVGHNAEARNQLLTRIVDKCLGSGEAPPRVAP
jgi:branched-subunit amino acid permease